MKKKNELVEKLEVVNLYDEKEKTYFYTLCKVGYKDGVREYWCELSLKNKDLSVLRYVIGNIKKRVVTVREQVYFGDNGFNDNIIPLLKNFFQVVSYTSVEAGYKMVCELANKYPQVKRTPAFIQYAKDNAKKILEILEEERKENV